MSITGNLLLSSLSPDARSLVSTPRGLSDPDAVVSLLDRDTRLGVQRLFELIGECRLGDYGLAAHCRNVAVIAERLARGLDCTPTQCLEAWLAGSLHDVGKVLISREIHFKPGPLSFDEHRLMRRHPELGRNMLSGIELPDVAHAVLSHHERLDGRGYPHGLVDAEIPWLARIVAVADFYVALRERRSYRGAHTHRATLAACQLAADDGHLDPSIVRCLTRHIGTLIGELRFDR
jgi:HD-GYP domain-containing protein (c-di-GMP phosphodiesterase class II)